MGRLAEQAFAIDALRRAWTAVLENDREDGVLSPSVARFSEATEDKLAQLESQLADGSYRPGSLTPVTMVTGDKERELHVPQVRDRIVARAILDVATPLIDPHLGPSAYAYRPGLGVADAVQAAAALRDEGLRWVLRTDVRDCFPTLPKHAALR